MCAQLSCAPSWMQTTFSHVTEDKQERAPSCVFTWKQQPAEVANMRECLPACWLDFESYVCIKQRHNYHAVLACKTQKKPYPVILNYSWLLHVLVWNTATSVDVNSYQRLNKKNLLPEITGSTMACQAIDASTLCITPSAQPTILVIVPSQHICHV